MKKKGGKIEKKIPMFINGFKLSKQKKEGKKCGQYYPDYNNVRK